MRIDTEKAAVANRVLAFGTGAFVPVVALLMFLTVWEVSVRVLAVSALILPPPSAVIGRLFGEFGYLLKHAGITMLESVLGFLLGGGAACALAILFQFSRTAERAIYPYAIALKAIPLVALAPLVVVWFGTGLASKVVLAAIISFFPILVNFVHGLRSVEQDALDLMSTFSASSWQILTKVRLPNALPDLFAGMKISSSFAVVGAVVAEFVGSQAGIGFVVKSSSYYLDTDIMFAAIVVAALSGLLFFGLIGILERRLVFWRGALETSP